MKRILLSQLLTWKQKTDRKPLILRGVRQCGKTYLLESFGKTYFPKYHLVNFEKQESACRIFDGDLSPSRIVNELCFLLNAKIDISKDLVVFDEIQACPRALTSLKYFCEDMPSLALCAAGSLLGLHLNEGSYPVGKVDMLHLYPLTFQEFLVGIHDQALADFLSHATVESDIPDAAHHRLWERLKQYFVVGGLPEVVTTFSQHQDNLFSAMQAVRQKQAELILGYYADIAKHSGKINAMQIDRTWRSVPMQLSQTQDNSVKKFKFKDVLPNMNRYAQFANVIDWLICAELIIPVYVLETVRLPLFAYTKQNSFKLMMFDIGMLGAMCDLNPKLILDYNYGSYKGFYAENFVAMQLYAADIKHLMCWQENRSEIEFLIEADGAIIPIEVKSGNITKAQSLQKFCEKYHPKKSVILSGKNIKMSCDKQPWQLRLYMTEKLRLFFSVCDKKI